MRPTTIDWDGVVLCGGASTRMGQDKSLLPVRGEPMAARVAAALRAAGAAHVEAVGGDVAALGAVGLVATPDRWPGQGPLGGVVQALTADGADAVAVLACDLVRPDPTSIATLVHRLATSSADAVVPVAQGRPQWLHGLWRRRSAEVVWRAFQAGERAVHRAGASLDVELVRGIDPATLADADDPAALPGARDPR